MENKNIKPINVLCYAEQTNIAGIGSLVRTKAHELYKDAIANDLEITGPVYWIYQGMDGDPQTVFTLEIAVPVHPSSSYKGKFSLKELPEFKCISVVHNGPWQQMSQIYKTLIGTVFQKKQSLSGICREIYINVNYIDFDKNITEIQVGIN